MIVIGESRNDTPNERVSLSEVSMKIKFSVTSTCDIGKNDDSIRCVKDLIPDELQNFEAYLYSDLPT